MVSEPSNRDPTAPVGGRIARLGGLCRVDWAEKRGKMAARQQVSEHRNVRRFDRLSAAIVIRWGIKRPPNGTKFGRRLTYNIIRPHAKFQPILRTFLSHL